MIEAVVGLGNPAPRYDGTRHNAGFAAADILADGFGADFREHAAGYLAAKVPGALVIKPLTYMNLSGDAVLAAVSARRIDVGGIVVVCDDFALPAGKVRVRFGGSDGGHNGLKSVINAVGPDFWRLRLGAGPLPPGEDASRFVLSRPSESEKKVMKAAEIFAAGLLRKLLETGADPLPGTWNTSAEVKQK